MFPPLSFSLLEEKNGILTAFNGFSRHSSIRGQRLIEELKTAIAAKETDIADAITSTDQQLSMLHSTTAETHEH